MRDRPGPRILGVRTTTQLDKAYEDGLLVEKTFDYFAQDKRGNVWYMGEDVTNFRYDDDGNLIGTDSESAWRAGRRGAKPGWIMPARQIIGQRYFQEIARARRGARQGQDPRASSTGCASAAPSTATCCRVLETNPFEPNDREFKYYAPRVGLIRIEEGLNKNLKNPDVVFNRDDDGRRAGPSAPTPRRRARRAPAAAPARRRSAATALRRQAALRRAGRAPPRRRRLRSPRPSRPSAPGRRGRSRPGSASGSSPTRPPSRSTSGCWCRGCGSPSRAPPKLM